MSKLKNYLKESSLSRLFKHFILHDCGIMSAFRIAEDCGKGERYSKNDNLKRNKSLLAKLKSKGYDITRILGKYPEGGVIKQETGFFIVDKNDNHNLEDDIIVLGREFEQDSVLFIPKNIDKTYLNKAYLIGTNRCINDFITYNQKLYFDVRKLGKSNDIYTTMVNGRPLVYEEIDKYIESPGSGMGWYAINAIAKMKWQDILIEEKDKNVSKKSNR